MRLDIYLTQNKLTDSRTEAKKLIESGSVKVNEKTITKPAFDVENNADISVDKTQIKYVSRGGLKLEGALDEFNVNPSGKLAIDIGASSGGFTDCLLQRGAKHVIALDSGTSQLVERLRRDDRVTSVENYNARYLSADDIEYSPDLAVMDVSFISATLIIPSLYNTLASGADFICLIKPQFEVGKANIGKGGIVKNEKIRNEAVASVIEFAKSTGFTFVNKITSPITGGDGNIEFLAHFKKP